MTRASTSSPDRDEPRPPEKAPSRPTASEVVREIAGQLIERAEGGGNGAAAERLRAELERPESTETTLVVVGETKRGKSSLVNALFGHPGLSPVDADVATSVHLVIRHAPEPGVRVHHDGGIDEVAPESLAEWATERGGRLRASRVSAVEIGLDHPLLARGLTVIDTPGVGGLDAAHREVTLAALARADALLFVLDPDAPISRPELRFLEEVTGRLGTVLFALTKVDFYPDWETILDADRELLEGIDRARGDGARFAAAPFIAVSNLLKEDADALRACGDEEGAREFLELSGFPALEAELEARVIGRARALRVLNLAGACRSAISALELPERVDSAGGDPALEAELEAARSRQEELRASQKSWPVDLTAELETLRVALESEYERRIAELSRGYEERITAGEEDDVEEWLPAALADDLRALAARLDAMMQEGVVDILGRLLEAFGLEGAGGAPGAEAGQLGIELPPLIPTAAEGPSVAQRALEFGRGGSLGAAVGGRLLDLVVPGAGLVLGTGAGLLLAGLNISLGKGQKARLAERQQAMRFVQRALGPIARAEVRAPFQARMAAIRRDLSNEVRARIDQRAAELQDALARHQRLMREDQLARQRAQEQAQCQLRVLEAIRERLDAAERVLASVRRAAPGAAR